MSIGGKLGNIADLVTGSLSGTEILCTYIYGVRSMVDGHDAAF